MPTQELGEACTAVKLVLPELRSGCGGDSSYSVQMREGGGAGGSQANWVPVLEGVTRGAATIEDLEPYTAYSFRVVSSNAKGTSPPGPPSAPRPVISQSTQTSASCSSPPIFHRRLCYSSVLSCCSWSCSYGSISGRYR